MNNIVNLTDGFIDLKINDNLPRFRNEHNKEYELIKETKCLFDHIVHKFVFKTVPENELYLATSTVQLSKLFQSAVVLFERGLLESGNIIIRSCLELSYKIVELVKNKNFIYDMKKELAFETRSTLNIINEKKLYKIVPKETVEDLLSRFDLKERKFKTFTVQLAEKNDLLDTYIMYRLYCNDSHQSMATLNEIQIFENEGVRLNGNLRLEDFSKAISMLISVVLIPFPIIIDKLFEDDEIIKKHYESLMESFQRTFENDGT